MYLPRTLELCTPHLAVWTGESGKRYDFAVLRTGTVWIDEPAVYVFARHENDGAKSLFVGETASLQLQFGGYRERVSEAWRAAMANGMTHVHVRFDPTSVEMRRAEVRDLIAALHPRLNVSVDERPKDTEEMIAGAMVAGEGQATAEALEAARAPEQAETVPTSVSKAEVSTTPVSKADVSTAPVNEADSPAAPVSEADDRTVRVPYRAGRLSPSRPSVEPGEPVAVHWLDEPTMPLWQFRIDPAGERGEWDLDVVPVTPEPLAPDSHALRTREHDSMLPSAGERTVNRLADETEQPVERAVAEVSVTDEAPLKPTVDTVPARGEDAVIARSNVAEEAAATTPTLTKARRRGRLLSRLMRLVRGRSDADAPARPDVTEPPVTSAAGLAAATPEPLPAGRAEVDVVRVEIHEERTGDVKAGEEIEASDARVEVVEITHAEVARDDEAGHEVVRVAVTRSEAVHEKDGAIVDTPMSGTAAAEAAAVEVPAAEAIPSAPERARARLQVAKRALALEPDAPVVLFAGDIGWHGGADILFEAMLIVCAGHPGVQFIYAGDGALRGELQERASHAALGSRCRFLGDVPTERFTEILDAADFVAIAARSPQGEDLALATLAQGKPVLATHQSGIGCVVHGRNGLVTYDNPGSFVWGVRELLGPLYGELQRQMDQMDRAA